MFSVHPPLSGHSGIVTNATLGAANGQTPRFARNGAARPAVPLPGTLYYGALQTVLKTGTPDDITRALHTAMLRSDVRPAQLRDHVLKTLVQRTDPAAMPCLQAAAAKLRVDPSRMLDDAIVARDAELAHLAFRLDPRCGSPEKMSRLVDAMPQVARAIAVRHQDASRNLSDRQFVQLMVRPLMLATNPTQRPTASGRERMLRDLMYVHPHHAMLLARQIPGNPNLLRAALEMAPVRTTALWESILERTPSMIARLIAQAPHLVDDALLRALERANR